MRSLTETTQPNSSYSCIVKILNVFLLPLLNTNIVEKINIRGTKKGTIIMQPENSWSGDVIFRIQGEIFRDTEEQLFL